MASQQDLVRYLWKEAGKEKESSASVFGLGGVGMGVYVYIMPYALCFKHKLHKLKLNNAYVFF